MKTLILIAALLLSSSAFAQHHGNHSSSNWVVPALIGGIIGYTISRPTVVQAQPQVYVYVQPAPVKYCEQKWMLDHHGYQRLALVCFDN